MAHKHIKTTTTINATPQKVWQVLTNFAQYPSWNPFLKSIRGQMQVGSKITINAGGTTFKPTVLVYKPHKELRWLGSLFMKGIFDGEHSFTIHDNGNGTVTFKHEEQFNGLLVGLMAKKLDNEVKQGFEQMNARLKALAESES